MVGVLVVVQCTGAYMHACTTLSPLLPSVARALARSSLLGWEIPPNYNDLASRWGDRRHVGLTCYFDVGWGRSGPAPNWN